MTTTPTPTATTSLLDEIVTGLQDPDGAAAGMRKLAAAQKAGATAKTAVPPKAEAPVAPQLTLTADSDVIIRPNGEKYYVRKFGKHDDVAVLRKSRETKTAVLLFGVPGNGKTAMFEAAFVDCGFEYVPGSGDTEVSDFIGSYIPLPGGDFAWVDGPLLRAMENGLPLLVDEIALIDPKVLSVVYSVMDGRGELNVTANPARGIVQSVEGFVVYGACNPNAPGARMSEALLSRFQIHAEVQVDFSLLTKMGCPRDIVTAAQNLRTKYEAEEVSWYPAIREVLNYKKIVEIMGREFALANLVSQAPEMDRVVVADVISRTAGVPVTALEVK